MTQVLSGKAYAKQLKEKLITLGEQWYWKDRYVAILFFGDNYGSQVYTRHKKKFGDSIGLEVRIIGQEKEHTLEEVLMLIDSLNKDDQCIGIMVQLPLPEQLSADKWVILTRIAATKDIDGLGWVAFGKAQVLGKEFYPGTPAAVLGLMDHHEIGNVKGKIIAILWQSLLVGSPLASILMQRWATVFSCNEHANQQTIKNITKEADIIISCTWVVHIVDDSYINPNKSQILIDVWYWQKDWKPAGDIDINSLKDSVKAYTPVPWWIGPVTIAQLFTNIVKLQEIE